MIKHAEYYSAIDADNAWQAALDATGIDRWSRQAKGSEGSDLRRLYDAKVAADKARSEARYHSSGVCGFE